MTALLARKRPVIMGILNITPDSFSDGGVFLARERALAHAEAMAAAGADIIDIGGESTRPGATPVSLDEELARVIPIVAALRARIPTPISIDTAKPAVMVQAVAAGAAMVNDVNALQADGALAACARLQVPICLMHRQGTPATMQQRPLYADVAREVGEFLRARVEACERAGIARARLVIDPGFGFGKTPAHNLDLLRRLNEFKTLGLPILVGLSRKSMIGALLGLPVERRLHASLALALLAVQNGAQVVRVHDVAATKEVLDMYAAYAGVEETQ